MKNLILAVIVILVAACGSGQSQQSEPQMQSIQDVEGAKATFAGGCFWCMEPPFEKLEGVKAVISGYTGGEEKNPTYNEVSRGTTGHVEAVQVIYDPEKISYLTRNCSMSTGDSSTQQMPAAHFTTAVISTPRLFLSRCGTETTR